MARLFGRWWAVLGVAVALGACSTPLAGPDIRIPPGAHPWASAQEIQQQVLDDIDAGERALGRSLAPRRFVKLWYAPAGTQQPALFRDGRNPGGGALILDTDGWIVEVEGTFVAIGLGPQMHGTRAYYAFDQDGSHSQAIIPCWETGKAAGDLALDGWCP